MKSYDIAEQVGVGSLPRAANGGEIGTCNFSAETGFKENAERFYSTFTLFATLRGGLTARWVCYIIRKNSEKQRRAPCVM